MIYDKRSYETMKAIEDALQSPITGIKTDDFEAMEKVISIIAAEASHKADVSPR